MKFISKIFLTQLSTALLLFYSVVSFAQYPGMNRVYSNMAMQNAMQMQRMQMNNLNFMRYAGNGDIYNVTFRDSSRKTITSLIYQDSATHKSFLLFVNKKYPKSDSAHRFQKIYTDQTIMITTDDPELGESIYGIPTDSCWSFKVIAGPLAVYAKNAYYLTASRKNFDTVAVIGIQLDKGPIEKLTEENLRKAVGSDPKALEFVDKKQLYKAVKRFNKDAEKATEK